MATTGVSIVSYFGYGRGSARPYGDVEMSLKRGPRAGVALQHFELPVLGSLFPVLVLLLSTNHWEAAGGCPHSCHPCVRPRCDSWFTEPASSWSGCRHLGSESVGG